ncbi:hypothetical protein [Streptomyces macrosporus]
MANQQPTERLVIALHRNLGGALQLQLAQLDADGNGHGYRLHGPKYLANSTTVFERDLTKRDAQEIRQMLDAVFPPTDTPDDA